MAFCSYLKNVKDLFIIDVFFQGGGFPAGREREIRTSAEIGTEREQSAAGRPLPPQQQGQNQNASKGIIIGDFFDI